MSEIELKYFVDPARAGSVDAAMRRMPSRLVSIESHCFDTEDSRLADARLSLRLRKTAGKWEQTLKGPGASAVERHEETVALPGKWAAGRPLVDPSLHDATAVGKVLRHVLGKAPSPLVEVHASLFRRRTVQVDLDNASVEVAFDRGTIRAGDRSATVCEVEYELKRGPAQALLPFAIAGIRAHGLWLCTISKSERGHRLAMELGGPAVKAEPSRLERDMNGPALLAAVLQACLDQVWRNASEIGTGRRDAELVHQLRVGLRRTRVALRELGGPSGAADPAWQGPFITAFRALGEFRDRQTVAAAIEPGLRAAGSPEPVLRPQDAPPPDPVDVVRSQAFQCALLDAWALTLDNAARVGRAAGLDGTADFDRESLDRPTSRGRIAPSGDAAALRPRPQPVSDAVGAMRQVGSRLNKLHARLKRDAQAFEREDEDAQHRVRKRLKRLRYLAEFVGPLHKKAAVKRYLARLRPAQDALGVHIDLIVGARMAREAALHGDAEAWFNVGWLMAQVEQSGHRCRKVLHNAAGAVKFWAG